MQRTAVGAVQEGPERKWREADGSGLGGCAWGGFVWEGDAWDGPPAEGSRLGNAAADEFGAHIDAAWAF